MTFNGRNALKAAIVLFIAAVVAALYFTPARQYMTREHIGEGVSLMRGLWYGPVVIVLAYAIGCIFALPASLFIIAAGVVWGWKLGGLYAMTGGMLALLENPGEWRKLRDDAGLVDRAVEEIVRWTTPVIQFCRTATEDVEIRGVKIEAGQILVMLYGSANRDEDVFGDDSEEFRVDRQPNPHLAFGFGEHLCLGAALARLEARVMFEELLRRYPSIELVGEVARMRATMVPGVKRMSVVLT